MSGIISEDAWVVMASFEGPNEPHPEFEDMLRMERERWEDEARQAGLDPKTNVRLQREGSTALVAISPELEKAFTPAQTVWKAE
ncbi:MAG: hypothetical protein ACOY4F_00360 [Thermodesulfobacteriota bacterium]